MNIEELKERLQQLKADNDTIKAKAESEKRDFTVEEGEKFDQNLVSFNATKKNIERLQEDDDNHQLLTKGTGRVSEPDQPQKLNNDAPEGTVERLPPKPQRTEIRALGPDLATTKNGGFRSLGEMALHVRRSCMEGGVTDPRLERLAAASTYGNESSGSDGGFAIPPDFRSAIMSTVMGEDTLASLCDQVPVSGNVFTAPVDETSPWQTSGGIQANWDGEADAATQSKPSLKERTVKLNKLRALVPMTEELLDDASAMDSYLRRKAPEKIAFKVNLAIVQGTGTGQPLGLLNSAALVTVSKNSPQTADTITGKNIIDMYSRMYSRSRSSAVWLINPDILPQLLKLSIAGTDNEGNAVTGWGSMVYMPPSGLSGAPYGTLMGRPIFPTEACETLGDKGDIFFVDLRQYLLLLKSGANPRVETSIHLWFDQDITAFKFVLRVGGVPWWSTTLAARDGSNTYSPYVTLEAR